VSVDVVVKIGGSLLQRVEEFDRVLGVVAELGRARRLLIVPGGGPFADAVRAVDARVRLSDDTAHWMAILAMDQHAHLIAERLVDSALVTSATEIAHVQSSGRTPVLAPYRWLREVDPLPHSWDVTSDSIAAWCAHAVGASQLVLIKPSGALGGDVVDRYFSQALPPGVWSACVPADKVDCLLTAGDLRQYSNARF
jgi:5-(aminomethyl)-3-furanmethanol phosphate kinase